MRDIKKLYTVAGTTAALAIGLTGIQPALAVSGNVEITMAQSEYKKGDNLEAEIKVKSTDGSTFLLQTNLSVSSGLTITSATGNNISYNKGTIVGTAPQSEFVIKIAMTAHNNGSQNITLTNTKLGAVDGSPNYTIAKTEKSFAVGTVETPKEDEKKDDTGNNTGNTDNTENNTQKPETTPSEPTQKEPEETKPENTYTPNPNYKSWPATVIGTEHLNVREGPGLDYKVKRGLASGYELTVIDEKKVGQITWLNIEIGWVSKDYIIEGHNISDDVLHPSKTDEEIEKEQQAQIKNEAQTTENKNQTTNQEAQKKDEDKKEQYDANEKKEEASVVIESQPAEIPPVEVTTETNESENLETNIDTVLQGSSNTSVVSGINPIIAIDGTSYVLYQDKGMNKPFYLYLEAYSLDFPEDYKKVAQTIGNLDFTMAIPKNLNERKPNTYLVYGNYDLMKDPELYYYDSDTKSFFPYDKMGTKMVVIDNTIDLTQDKVSKSKILIFLAGIISIYTAGIITTILRYKARCKRDEEEQSKQATKNAKPKPSSTTHTAAEVMKMDDTELEDILKLYGASTEDIMTRQTQRLGNLKDVPVAKHTSKQSSAPNATTNKEQEKKSTIQNTKQAQPDANQSKESNTTSKHVDTQKEKDNTNSADEKQSNNIVHNNKEQSTQAVQLDKKNTDTPAKEKSASEQSVDEEVKKVEQNINEDVKSDAVTQDNPAEKTSETDSADVKVKNHDEPTKTENKPGKSEDKAMQDKDTQRKGKNKQKSKPNKKAVIDPVVDGNETSCDSDTNDSNDNADIDATTQDVNESNTAKDIKTLPREEREHHPDAKKIGYDTLMRIVESDDNPQGNQDVSQDHKANNQT